MIKVSVLYRNDDASKFDSAYYLGKHMPMVKEKFGALCRRAEVDFGLGGGVHSHALARRARAQRLTPAVTSTRYEELVAGREPVLASAIEEHDLVLGHEDVRVQARQNSGLDVGASRYGWNDVEATAHGPDLGTALDDVERLGDLRARHACLRVVRLDPDGPEHGHDPGAVTPICVDADGGPHSSDDPPPGAVVDHQEHVVAQLDDAHLLSQERVDHGHAVGRRLTPRTTQLGEQGCGDDRFVAGSGDCI